MTPVAADAFGDPLSVVVLSGGTSRRMGRDKAGLRVGAGSLLQRTLAGLPPSVRVIVVGDDPGDLGEGVLVTREEPPGGGPVAGLAAGLELVLTELVAVCAVDMPWGGGLLAEMAAELAEDRSADAVLPVDVDGHEQPLCAVYRAEALRGSLAGLGGPADRSMRALVAGLRRRPFPIAGDDDRLTDLDTPSDLARVRDRLDRH